MQILCVLKRLLQGVLYYLENKRWHTNVTFSVKNYLRHELKKSKQTCVVGKVLIMLMQPRIVRYMERVSLITANFKIEQFSDYINLHFSSSESLIFTSQVSDLLTLIYPLADSASVDIICSEVPGHPINLHIVDSVLIMTPPSDCFHVVYYV